MQQELPQDIETALYEVQQYLLDQIPPLTACDSIETLMTQPPELLMTQIQTWISEQSRLQSVPLSDYLFHALKKVHAIGDLKLIERAAVDSYIDKVIPLALQVCPASDRDLLKQNLHSMRQSRVLQVTRVDVARQKTEEIPVSRSTQPGAPMDEIARSARRFSLVVDRLSRQVPETAGAVPATAGNNPAAQLLTMAATSSSSEQELEQYMQRLQPIGGGESANVFGLLGSNLPSWDIVMPNAQKPAASLNAMHKIMSLAKDPAKRFRELMTAAVEQFNSGALSAAVSMLELAELALTEKKLDPGTTDRIRAESAESITSEQLRKYAENKSKHPLLRKALGFFPSLTRESLLQQLRGEERPEKRRALLGLLEAYGAEGRKSALTEFDLELQKKPEEIDTYYLRNLIYLLHRIGRETEEDLGKELDLISRSSARGQNIYVIKEAVAALGQIKNEASVKLLTTRLAEFEAILLRNDSSMYSVDEMQKLLDRIISSLARIATPVALRMIAKHGMKANPLLGDTRARLASLSQHDLSFDEETVNVLLTGIREDLPKKIFGRVVPMRQVPTRLIEALTNTRSEKVEELFAEVVEKYADHELGYAAAAALASRASAKQGIPGRDASLTGDLQFFGLPSLTQSLAESQATGIVTLTTKQGTTAGKLVFFEGKFLTAQAGHLRGSDALYQLLERPTSGTFAFVAQSADSLKGRGEPTDVMPLLFEGIRRHDELNQAAAVVPDDLVLKTTQIKPAPDADETDPGFIREVWINASSGLPVAEWEPKIAADAYRIRRLVARWVEEGALQPG